MNTIAALTTNQFTELLDGYFKAPEARKQMTELEVREIAEKLNQRINVPIISETKEEKILIKIVIKIDSFLYDSLPNEFYDLVRSLDKGIDDSEAKRLVIRLSKLANKKIDIPYLPERAEFVAIRFVVGIIINAARKSHNFQQAKESAFKMNIPIEESVSDESLASIIVT